MPLTREEDIRLNALEFALRCIPYDERGTPAEELVAAATVIENYLRST